MKTILCIVHIISSLHRGGAETILLSVVKELQKRGWQQTVLYIYDGPIREELTNIGVPCHCFRAPGSYANPLMWYRLYSHLRTIKPDVIHTSLWAANLMGRIVGSVMGIPVVASLHAVAAHEGNVRNAIDRVLPIRTPKTIAVSQGIADSVIAAGMYKKTDVVVVPNGIDVEGFRAVAKIASEVAYTRQPGDWVIGAVGRLVPVKRFDLLINVFAQFVRTYTHARLLIIGTGPAEHALRELIAQQECASRITLITNQKSAPYYRYFDCFVQPSEYEGLSLALLEALTMELPVVVTGRSGIHEVITHGVNGMVIPANDESALYHALIELITNAEQTNALRTAGHQCVIQDYALDHMVNAYEEIFVKQSGGLLR